MKSYYNSKRLIDRIRSKGSIPVSDQLFKDEEILEFANEEIDLGILPTVLELHEDYFLYVENVNMEANKIEYAIPYRSVGNKLRDVQYIDSSGNNYELSRIPIDHLSDYSSQSASSIPRYFYVKNNRIVLVSSLGNNSGVLSFSFYMRPNQLVKSDRVGIISNVNHNTKTVTLKSLPSNFSTTEKFDVIQERSPHRTIAYDLSIASIATLPSINIVIPSLPDDVIPGDRLCLAEQSDIPQIPSELHNFLAQRVYARLAEAMGDTEALQTANAKIAELENKTGRIIDNRIEGSPKKIVGRNNFLSNIARTSIKRFRR